LECSWNCYGNYAGNNKNYAYGGTALGTATGTYLGTARNEAGSTAGTALDTVNFNAVGGEIW